MPTIEMSQPFAQNISARIMRRGESWGGPYNSAESGLLPDARRFGDAGFPAPPLGFFYILKGTVPTTPNIASISVRVTDILITFRSTDSLGQNFQTSQISVNPTVITTEYVNATASGNATWFWWVVAQNDGYMSSSPNLNAFLYHQIIGTVGITGSGADLQMPTINIVLGEPYRIMNFRLKWPTSWTY